MPSWPVCDWSCTEARRWWPGKTDPCCGPGERMAAAELCQLRRLGVGAGLTLCGQ